mmetsp:Transcript_92321/g.211350  ORF Transcript_92321/g.211350 Transcript_92321/m.211350 type:complete len:371 (+) Transcript_92321:63-1175(+)
MTEPAQPLDVAAALATLSPEEAEHLAGVAAPTGASEPLGPTNLLGAVKDALFPARREALPLSKQKVLDEVAAWGGDRTVPLDRFGEFVRWLVARHVEEVRVHGPEGESVWYFAIGSMMNKVSLSGRKLKPHKSFPAKLPGFRLDFRGEGGMAFAAIDPDSSMHGVLHLMSAKDMCSLDTLEMTYSRVQGMAEPYEGEPICCTLYTNPTWEEPQPLGTPTQRYIEIMVEGCRSHGVKEEWIERLLSNEAQPRRPASEFRKFEVPSGSPVFTWDQIRRPEAGTHYTTCNFKVFKHTGSETDPGFEMIQRISGNDCTFFIGCSLYDPKYGMPKNLEDMSEEHRASVEDMMTQFPPHIWKWEPVGWVEGAPHLN